MHTRTTLTLNDIKDWLTIASNEQESENDIFNMESEPIIGAESDPSDSSLSFEKEFLQRKDIQVTHPFVIISDEILNAWVESPPPRPLLPSLFDTFDDFDIHSIEHISTEEYDDQTPMDDGPHIEQRDTIDNAFDCELQRVFHYSQSIPEWILGTQAYTKSELHCQNASMPQPEPWLHPRQLERQIEALIGYKARLSTESLDMCLGWNLAKACHRGFNVASVPWNLFVLQQDWRIENVEHNMSPQHIRQYMESLREIEFQEAAEKLCILYGPPPSIISDCVPENILASFMDDFEKETRAGETIHRKSQKLENRSQSMLDRFLQIRGRVVPDSQKSHKKKRKIEESPNPINSQSRKGNARETLNFELPIQAFDCNQASMHQYFTASRIICQSSFIKLLENDYKIDLIERVIDTVDEQGELQIAEDFVIDSKTCVFIHPHSLLIQHVGSTTLDQMIKDFLKTQFGSRLLKVALKYSVIHILFSADDTPHLTTNLVSSNRLKTYPFTPPLQRGLINAALCFSILSRLLNIDIFYHVAETDTQKAWLIRAIGDATASAFEDDTPGKAYRSKKAWEAREWILPEETDAERFLTEFPVINCFQAQILLSQTTSLRDLLLMPLSELIDRYSLWVPERNLTLWYDLTRSGLIV